VPLIVKTKGGRSYDQAAKSKWSLLHLRRAERSKDYRWRTQQSGLHIVEEVNWRT